MEVNDVLVNKESPIKMPNSTKGIGIRAPDQYTATPEKWKGSKNADGHVDSVMISSNHDDSLIVKVRIRSTRIPELGDKFSSRHGQKGVVGLIVNQEVSFIQSVEQDEGLCTPKHV